MDQSPSKSLGSVGWAVFLGCSWTWCIGMYLPALMIRDLGLWGYVVFAVPNVIGAAAMGWVLRSREASVDMVQAHRPACRAFSIVTIAFHAYWLAWIGTWTARNIMLPWWTIAVVLGMAVLGLGVRACLKHDEPAKRMALVVWIISAGLLVALTLSPATTPSTVSIIADRSFSTDMLWLAPASIFGFLLCPYLDLTFHRARQGCATRTESKIAFGLGFGVFFFSMIVLTFLYAGPIVAMTDGDPETTAHVAPWIGVYLVAHLLIQLIFTVGAHSRELARKPVPDRWVFRGSVVFALAFGAAAVWVPRSFDMAGGEIGYRLFLSFYGLVFPTYVWLNMVDLRERRLAEPTAMSLRVTFWTIIIAAPFFFAGFILRQEIMLVPGVAMILLAKAFVGRPVASEPLVLPI
ncbi:MAG TPA: hypothetical protein ENJ00_03260 [Phycisphaerales bacterium]|nr:hypothetical protein [Phycisphaerales bacterium]